MTEWSAVPCPVSTASHSSVAAQWSKYHCIKHAPLPYDLRCSSDVSFNKLSKITFSGYVYKVTALYSEERNICCYKMRDFAKSVIDLITDLHTCICITTINFHWKAIGIYDKTFRMHY